MLKTAILIQKKNEKTNKREWALISKKTKKVLKWFGVKKPSKERVYKEEKRIQFFKYQSDRMEIIKKLGKEKGEKNLMDLQCKLSVRHNTKGPAHQLQKYYISKTAKYIDLNAQFYYAVKEGDMEKAKYYLGEGANVNAYDSISINVALKNKDNNMVNFLLSYGLIPINLSLADAIKYGREELVKLFIEKYGLKPTEDIFKIAVQKGNIELAKLLIDQYGLKPTENMFKVALSNKQFELAKLFIDQYGLEPTENMFDYVVVYFENAEFAKTFIEKYGLNPTEKMLNTALRAGNVELVKLFIEKYGLEPKKDMFDTIIIRGHTELLKLFIEKYGLEPTKDNFNRAFRYGRTEMVKFLIEKFDFELTKKTLYKAICRGKTEIIKLFIDHYGLEPTEDMLSNAINCQTVELAKLFIEQYGLKPNKKMFESAVGGGDVELIKLLEFHLGEKAVGKGVEKEIEKDNKNTKLKKDFLSKKIGPVYENYKDLGYDVEKHLADSLGVLDFLNNKSGTIIVEQQTFVPEWFDKFVQSSFKYFLPKSQTIEQAWSNGLLNEIVKTQQGEKLRPAKIGKILNEISATQEQKKEFEERKIAKKTLNWIIKTDFKNILMMTQGRGWESGSCMRPGESYERGPLKDACVGSAVIYFYKQGAKEPCGRELLRPGVTKNGEPFIVRGGKIYGDGGFITDKEISTQVPIFSANEIPKDSYIFGMHDKKNDLYLDTNPLYEAIKAPGEKVLMEIGEKFMPFRDQDSTPEEFKEILPHLSKRQKEEKQDIEKSKPLNVKKQEEKNKDPEDKYMDIAGNILPEEYSNDGFKISKRQDNLIKEATGSSKKTAESLFKIIQFLFYRTPSKDKRQYLNRVRGKVVRLSPSEIGYKKMSPSAVVGQAVSLSKNLLAGLNPVFVGQVLEELVRMLIENAGTK